ncbi:MAG: carboxylesterase family protein [Myxococcota bacterium]|nr:carboxylesterase family protein [Myxococcota bacterium]
MHILILSVLVLLSLGCSDKNSGSSNQACTTENVETTSGTVCGQIETPTGLGGLAAEVFLGIPFAETTAGENRWRPPIPKTELTGVFRAVENSPGCPQEDQSEFGLVESETSEDCLTVNVWRPHGTPPPSPLPVLVWIYGGSFDAGANSVPMYDGAYMAAQQDVVVVTLNYRVGALGFLTGIDGLEGNYGLRDQQLALQWVSENAAAFGGDPSRVTLFGQSAGAMSVGLHALSIPSSRNPSLFQAIIMESNPFGLPFKTKSQATADAELLSRELGCEGELDKVNCMRAATAQSVVTAQASTSAEVSSILGADIAGLLVFAPTIDG